MNEALRLDNQLCFALQAASRAMTAAYRPHLSALELTYPQYLIFLVLWEEDGASVSRLGERLHLDSATLTPLLKRLEARGFVTRRRSTKDERVVEIFLTTEGKRLERRAASIPAAMARACCLSRTDAVALRDALKELTQDLDRAATE
jgi:DNA-binding MarR family transcriptional regulator